MSGRRSRNAGARYELELKKIFESQGFHAERVYGSGAIGTRMGRRTEQNLHGDVLVKIPASTISPAQAREVSLEVEVKYRSKGFPKWLVGLTEPTRVGSFVFTPGNDLVAALQLKVSSLPSLEKPVTRYEGMIGDSPVLALRFPIRGKSTGWVLGIPEVELCKMQSKWLTAP